MVVVRYKNISYCGQTYLKTKTTERSENNLGEEITNLAKNLVFVKKTFYYARLVLELPY